MSRSSSQTSFELIARQKLHVLPPAGRGRTVLTLAEGKKNNDGGDEKVCVHVFSSRAWPSGRASASYLSNLQQQRATPRTASLPFSQVAENPLATVSMGCVRRSEVKRSFGRNLAVS